MNDPIALSSSPPSSAPALGLSPGKKSPWLLYLAGGVILAGAAITFAAASAYSNWRSSSFLAPGIFIAGVDVGGLSKNAASTQLEQRFGDLPLKLTLGQTAFKTTLGDLGGRPSIDFTLFKAAKIGREGGAFANFFRVYAPKSGGDRMMLPIEWNKARLVANLRQIDKKYAKSSVNARLVVDSSSVRVVPEQVGRSLNIGATAKEIQNRYFVGTHAIKAYARSVVPPISAADLQGQDVLLAAYPTLFNPRLRGRTANIRVACAAMEGRVLMPGDSFSFNSTTGKRTWEKGYRMAHIFETKPGADQAEIVDGLAGGVCQVSSTLYNAVRRANQKMGLKGLKIVERNSHSLPVDYVPSGLDATVAWPYKDFRFRNTLNHPVYLRTHIRRGKLTISVWGRVPNLAANSLATPNAAGNSNL